MRFWPSCFSSRSIPPRPRVLRHDPVRSVGGPLTFVRVISLTGVGWLLAVTGALELARLLVASGRVVGGLSQAERRRNPTIDETSREGGVMRGLENEQMGPNGPTGTSSSFDTNAGRKAPVPVKEPARRVPKTAITCVDPALRDRRP